MKLLVIGAGGREHALAWKLAQSPNVEQVYVAPGNAGTGMEAKLTNIDIAADNIEALLHFAQTEAVDLTVVGPEIPLVAGVVDRFEASGLKILGPNQYAAQLEGSKSFAKQFMQEFDIPTAAYGEFTDAGVAIEHAAQIHGPIVIKADGLAAGKGVVITQSRETANSVITDMLSGNLHGSAGRKIIIEEFLRGEEVSFICIVDGKTILPLATSQDHKARDDGDSGPNTGGMGAYSPAPLVTDMLHQQIVDQVIEPVVSGMKMRGNQFKGFLYAGLMIGPDQSIKVLEFNCRFGDPETQPVLMRLQSDFAEMCWMATTAELHNYQPKWDPRSALTVVMAAGGYPDQYRKGDPISGLPQNNEENVKVFHAGTRFNETDKKIVTAGGRVLGVTALGNDIQQAQQLAYQTVEKIQWDDVYFRRDIGYRAIQK